MKKITFLIAFIALAFLSKAQEVKKEYYPSGKIHYEKTFANGKMNGPWIEYYENGKKKQEKLYQNNKSFGYSISYHSNGKKKSIYISTLESNRMINPTRYTSGGALDSMYDSQTETEINFYPSGKIKSYGKFKPGVGQQGTWYYYNEDGSLKNTKKF